MRLSTCFLLSVLYCMSASAQQDVKYSGAMSNVMKKGELHGTISIDTIKDRLHLYGLGPVEYLTGELIIVDGHPYQAKVMPNNEMQVSENYVVKAPFFVYTHVAEWKEHPLPDSITNISLLEAYLDKISQPAKRPFAFKLAGKVATATIHIVNLPPGTKVKKPADAHKGRKYYELQDANADIVGFFSTEHQTVFTHHDSYTHMHLVTADRTKMGHLDKLKMNPGTMKLYLPF